MRTLHKIIALLVVFMIIAGIQTTSAQKKEKEAVKEDPGSVDTKLITPDPNAFYVDKAKYIFEVLNTTNNAQEGTVSYQVFSETGEKLNYKSINVKIPKKTTVKYPFEIPEDKPGFYKVSFMINVTDDDDTTRRVFGIRPEQIKSPYSKPPDFESFWQSTKAELVLC